MQFGGFCMQVLTLIRVLFFNLIFLFWASIAFSGVAHQIPSDLLADDYESSDKSVNIVVRNGVKELRFKKNQSVNFKVNLSKAGLYKVRVHYSSKGTTPQLNAKVNDGQKLDFNFEATPYNSDYVDRNIPEYFEFLYGEQIFTLKAKSDNFYLVRLEFIKVDYLYEKVPGEIRAGAFFKNPDPVTTYVRDGQQEIQFKKDQKIFYKLDVKEAGYYDLYLEYSSPNYNPLIRLDFQEASVDDSQLPKTSSASDFIDEATGHRIKLYPGYNEMEFLSMRAGFNLRKVELKRIGSLSTDVPGKVSAAELLSTSGYGKVLKNGGEWEYQFQKNERVKYRINVAEDMYLKFDFKYIAQEEDALIEFGVGNSLYNYGAEKTNEWKNIEANDSIFFSKGSHEITIRAKNSGFRLRNFNAKEGNAGQALALYQVNSGGPTKAEFKAELGINDSLQVFNGDQNLKMAVFGSFADSTREISLHSRDSSVPTEVPTDIFKTLRVEKNTADYHSSGLVYRFSAKPGNYRVRLHSVSLNVEQRIRVESEDDSLKEVFVVPSNSKNVAYSVEYDLSLGNGERELIINLIPEFPTEKFQLAGIEIFSDSELNWSFPNLAKRYISNGGRGSKDGLSWENAANIGKLNQMIGELSNTGGEVLIDSQSGVYELNSELVIKKGGASSSKKVIVRSSSPNAYVGRAEFAGTRIDPWPEAGAGSPKGKQLFVLLDGADNLEFRDISVKNFGNGVVRVGANIENLSLIDMDAKNVAKFFENYISDSAQSPSADVDGLVAKFIDIRGYDQGGFRFKHHSKNLLVRHIYGDSEMQRGACTAKDKCDFAMGISVEGHNENVVLRQSTMLNHHQFNDFSGAYYNGDSVASEGDVTNLLIMDFIAAGNTDAGFDIKTQDAVLIRTVAIDNKRNYRSWKSMELEQVSSISPNHRGGSGSRNHFWAYKNSPQIYIYNSFVYDEEDIPTFAWDDNPKATFHVSDESIFQIKNLDFLREKQGSYLKISEDTILIQN